MDSNDILRKAEMKASNGYARDILNWIINPWKENQSVYERRQSFKDVELYVGDMFRSLILDGSWPIDEARDVYYAAMDRIEKLEEELFNMEKSYDDKL